MTTRSNGQHIADNLRLEQTRSFRNTPEVEAAACRTTAAFVVRNEPRSTDDDLRDQLVELLQILGLVSSPDPVRPRRHR